MTLVGPKERIKERLQVWRDSRITTLLVATTDQKQLQDMAELIL